MKPWEYIVAYAATLAGTAFVLFCLWRGLEGIREMIVGAL